MISQVSDIVLNGAGRELALKPGLNIVAGPIASGKTTFVRYLRFLLGGSLGQPPKEARASVTAVSGTVNLNGKSFLIARPAISTPNARVEIAGDDRTWRLPAYSSLDGNTYTNWLLQQMELPRIEVPSAPTKPDSDPTPISIGDYFLYSYLAQGELGFSVFGHRDPFKNIKRKYVFEITYGFYDLKTAQLQERLRKVQGQLRELRARETLFETFFEGTPLANKAGIEHELREVNRELREVEALAMDVATPPHESGDTALLQADVLELEATAAALEAGEKAEHRALTNLRELASQLESQSAKLTRSIVSHKHLTDLDFVVCPRCGSGLEQQRVTPALCYLCIQEPSLEFSREALVNEQGAVEQQLTEAQDLLRARETRSAELQNQLTAAKKALVGKRLELDFQTKSYVSEHAAQIASVAARRARLTSRSAQLEDYLSVLAKIDDAQRLKAKLAVEKDRIEQDLAASAAEAGESQDRVGRLSERFNEILEQLKPPKFGEEQSSAINPNTYLPVYYGRPFAELSSPGLATLVNVAHALAHQLTAIELKLKLPQILIIDGLSEHLGQEGLDPERLAAVYKLLIDTSRAHPDLQVIVVDNDIPQEARPFVRLELSEEDRLIRSI